MTWTFFYFQTNCRHVHMKSSSVPETMHCLLCKHYENLN
jgi:hypothetical protein